MTAVFVNSKNNATRTQPLVTQDQLTAEISALNASLAAQVSVLSSLYNDVSSQLSSLSNIVTNINAQIDFKVDTRSLSSIDPEISKIVNEMTVAGPNANSLAQALSSKLNSSATCQCVDPLAIQVMNSTLAYDTQTIRRSVSCSGHGMIYSETSNSCVYAQPFPACPHSISSLNAHATVISCSETPRVGSQNYLFGTTCQVSCNPGFVAASTVYTCNSSGVWTLPSDTSFDCVGQLLHEEGEAMYWGKMSSYTYAYVCIFISNTC